MMRSSNIEKVKADLGTTTKRLQTAKQLRTLLEHHYDEKIMRQIDQIDQVADENQKKSLSSERALLKIRFRCLQTLALDDSEDLTKESLDLIFADIEKCPKKASSYDQLSPEQLLEELKGLLPSLEKLQAENHYYFSYSHGESGAIWRYSDEVPHFQTQVSDGKTTSDDVKRIVYLIKYLPMTLKNLETQKQLKDQIVELETRIECLKLVLNAFQKEYDIKLEQLVGRIDGASEFVRTKCWEENYGRELGTPLSHLKKLIFEPSNCAYLAKILTEENLDSRLLHFEKYSQAMEEQEKAMKPVPEEKATKPAPTLATTNVTTMFMPVNKTAKNDNSVELSELNKLLTKHGVEIKENPASKQSINEVHYRIFVPKSVKENPNSNFFIELFKKKGIINEDDTICHKEVNGNVIHFYCINTKKLPREKIIGLTDFIALMQSLPLFPHLSQQVQHNKLGR